MTLEGADGTCAVPTVEFNLVQQLSHMMSHVMGEGIGLKYATGTGQRHQHKLSV